MAFQLNSKDFNSYTKYPFYELLSFNCKLLYSEQVTGLEPANLLHGKQTRYQLRYTCIYRFYMEPANLPKHRLSQSTTNWKTISSIFITTAIARRYHVDLVERQTGIEPAKPSAWKADVQPFTPLPH